MAASLETNKLLAALLTAGIIASGSGVVSRILYHPEVPEEPAYAIAVPEEGGEAAAGDEAAHPIGVVLASADAGAGEGVAKKCASCHSFEEGGANKIGPALHGVVGREIAAAEGFAYSDALASLEGAWDYEALSQFLANPKGYAPGTKMAFAGVKQDSDRADLILYLRSISPDAPPLPEAEPAAAEGGGEQGQGGGEQQEAQGGEQGAPSDPGQQQAEGEQRGQAGQEQAGGQQMTAATSGEQQPAGGGGGAASGAVAMIAVIAAADASAGETVAKRKCVACHSFEEGGANKVGPNLHGVVGREIAAHEGFKYSSALQGKDGSWDYGALDAFLSDPKGWASGTKMAFAGLKKDDERAQVLAYLRSISPDAPPPPGQ
jgi:cytochrome c